MYDASVLSLTGREHLSYRLPVDFVQGYVRRPVQFGFPIGGNNSLGELTMLDKYAAKKEDGTKERWWEICRRVTEGVYSTVKDYCLRNRTPWSDEHAHEDAQEMFDRMFHMKWVPPGRGLQFMGRAYVWEEGSACLQNCFRGTEEIITREHGAMPLAELVGEKVEVAIAGGGWAGAEVKHFGKQPVQRITFAPASQRERHVNTYVTARSNHRVDVVATPDHRWLLAGGEETTRLVPGDVVPSCTSFSHRGSPRFEAGVVHGLIFGDGTAGYHYKNGDREYHIRLCGERAQKYVHLFEDVNNNVPSYGGDPWCRLRSPEDLKDFPQAGVDTEYLQGFLWGWMAADATLAPAEYTWILASQHPGAKAWLEANAASAGWILKGFNMDPVQETNLGVRKNPCYRYTLTANQAWWKVTSIEVLPEEEDVYCAVVPEVGAFALANGIYTGNCAFLSTANLDKDPVLPFVRLMEMSMLGIGVGTDTRGAGLVTVGRPTNFVSCVTVEDSREGWVDVAARVLSEYLVPATPYHVFDFSNVRPAGSLIKRFGGTAAGPGPLMELVTNLRSMLDSRSGEIMDSRLITDLDNMVGRCVVSGNLRRTAEIVLGEVDDKDFLSLKDWTLPQNDERLAPKTGWGYISNNSVIGHVGMDLQHVIPGMAMNGEPGIYYLDLAQQYGRLADPPNGKNWRVTGCNPCVEQPLEDHELCTLVETFPARHDDVEDFRRTLKYAYLYGKAVTLIPTHWQESNTVMVRNRRIGCSMSGVVQFVAQRGLPELRKWCDEGYAEVCRRDHQYSDWLGIRESIGKTSVKPSGTVSIVAGATPGVHYPVRRGRYWRRVRYSKHNPTLAVLEAAGYHVEDCVNEPHATSVVRFPTIGPDVRGEDEATLFEKAAMAAFLQRHWADNMVSATFTFAPDEADQVPNVLATFEGQLKAASFLPLSSGDRYPQMPYEDADPQEWQEAFDSVQRVDVEALYGEQALEATGDKFCSSDVCEMKSEIPG